MQHSYRKTTVLRFWYAVDGKTIPDKESLSAARTWIGFDQIDDVPMVETIPRHLDEVDADVPELPAVLQVVVRGA